MTKDVFETAARAVRARQRIRPFIYETPLIPSRAIGPQTASTVLFKAENLQLTGSFKIRGLRAR
ncbi:pyridoxal-phosphate dependent enzyme (plasmid) [Ensifer adhaerens]